MNTKLTIQEKLKDLRVERHLTLEQLAEETGLSKSALGKYESDDFKDISPFSIVTLAKFYGVSTDYLLGLTETKNHPNADLHDLHLSDEVIELLKSGKLNNRLLSEMALHKDFQRFLVDIEIFVDRVADMRINAMNAILEANRKQIMEKHNPGENDLYVRTLELAQVTELWEILVWEYQQPAALRCQQELSDDGIEKLLWIRKRLQGNLRKKCYDGCNLFMLDTYY